MNSGSFSEFALVGNHGVVGVSLVLGSMSMPSRSAERQLGIQDPCAGDPRRRRASWADSAFAVEPHANPDHAGSAIGGVQPPPRGGATALPFSAAAAGQLTHQRIDDHARADRPLAGRALRERSTGRSEAARGGLCSLL